MKTDYKFKEIKELILCAEFARKRCYADRNPACGAIED